MRSLRKRSIRAAVVLLFLLVTPALILHAQKTTGTIRGTVTDPTGAIVPGATVTATNEATRRARETTSNEIGEFSFPDLPNGRYRVAVKNAGFKESVQTGVELSVAGHVVVNFALEVGAAAASVIVESAQLAVELTAGEVGGTINSKQVRELPLNGRSFTQLVTLMPGVAPADSFDTKNKGLFSGVDLSVSGGAPNANLWMVDGSNNNDVGSNRTILVYPSIDAIEEFRIHRNSYGAEFGQASGAQVNIVTRSGTNDFHGNAYYFGRNDALNATDYFLNLGGQPKQVLKRNDYGYTFGGPIAKDRAFFFWSQEWNIERRGIVNSALVPTAAEKRGDFSAAVHSGCNPDPVDPLTGAAFPGGVIPMMRLSPAGLLFVQLYADPNVAPTAANPCPNPNWVNSTTVPIDWRQENIKVDWNLTKSAALIVRYTQDAWENGLSAGTVTGLWGDDAFPAVDSSWDQPGRVLTAKWSQTIGPDTVNDFQFSYSANRITITRGAGDQLINQINAALPPIFPVSDKTYGAQRTHPTFWGAQGYPALWHLAPWDNNQDLFVWKDDFSKVWRQHTFKAGFLGSTNIKDEIVAQPEEAGQFWGPGAGFQGSSWGSGMAATGNVIADLVLRDVAWGFAENQRARDVKQRWRDIEFYGGDTWRVHRRLTLDLGLRWSLFRRPFLANDELTSFNPALFNPALGTDPCNGLVIPPGSNACQGFMGGTPGVNRALVEQDNNTISPRLGIAWDVFGDSKTALRMGIGQFFLREMLNPSLLAGGLNSPFNPTRGDIRFLDSANPSMFDPFFGGNGTPAFGLDRQGLTPNTWQWNLTVERELWRATKWEISYVGNRGIHLLKRLDVNQVLPGDRNSNGVDDRLEFVRAPGGTGAVGLRPFGANGANSAIIFFTGASDSVYHSLQTLFQTRIQRESVVRLNYTWSRLISNDPNVGGSFNNDASFSDNTNFRLDRGLADLHRPHVFTADLIYHLPKLDQNQKLLRQAFGDWQIGSIVTMSSGPGLTVNQGGLTGINGFAGTGIGDNQRPNRVAGLDCRPSGGPDHQWLNPAAFTFVGYQLGVPGNSPRGVCQGPGSANWDFSFTKNWNLPLTPTRYFGENLKIQFRLELFNAFNTPQFRAVDTDLGATRVCFDTDVMTCDTGATMPAGIMANTTSVRSFTPSTNFGRAGRTRGPREIQYAIKFIW